MKTLALLIALSLGIISCTKAPMPTPSTPNTHKAVKPSSIYDTLNFYVYACHFDSLHTPPYVQVMIKVVGTNDSINVNCGTDFNHTYKGYVLDTTSNKNLTGIEDSTFVRLPILTAGDTIKYYLISSLGKIHAADFVVSNHYTFTRVWENSLFAPYGNSGVHISAGYVNDIYIP